MRENLTYRCEVVDILEVQHDREAEWNKVSDARIVHEVLPCKEGWAADEDLQIIEPEDAPEDLTQVESVKVEAFEGAIEVWLSHTIDLNRDKGVLPI